jgi:WD40 repeat protein/beta-lactamase regulating signal transducer with metallopeptidase domain
VSTLLQVGISNALAAGVLALLVALLGRLCKRPALVHGLWLLVLLKLVTPPFLCWHLPWPVVPEAGPEEPAAVTVAYLAAPGPEEAPPPATRGAAGAPVAAGRVRASEVRGGVALPGAGAARTTASRSVGLTRSWRPEVWLGAFGWVWAAGAVVWFLRVAWHLGCFRRLLRHARPAPADLQARAEHLAGRLGLARCPSVWLVPGAVPPMVWAGLGSPRLFFPEKLLARLDEEGRATLLAHELAHVRRWDHWVRRLELVVQGLYWWYPLVWWVRRQIEVHEEECCDAYVVGELPPRVYAAAILETLDFLAETRPALPLAASGLSRVTFLKRRFMRIMHRSTPKQLTRGGRLVLLGLFPLLILGPAFAQPDEKAPAAAAVVTVKELPAALADEPLGFAGQPANLLGGAAGSPVLALAYAPDGRTLALATEDDGVQLRDAVTGNLRARLKGLSGLVDGLAFSPDGRTLATAGWDKTVRLWDAATGRPGLVLAGHTNPVFAVAFSPDGRTLASSGYDRQIKLWDPATGQERVTLQGHSASVRALAFSPDGTLLASAGGDGAVKLWDLAARAARATLKGHTGVVRALAFSPDGRALASAGEDGSVKLWDVAAGAERATLRVNDGEVWALAFSPRGGTLAAAGLDQTLRLWDPVTGQLRSSLRGHNDCVTAVAFAPDGKSLATGSLDRTVKLWHADPAAPRVLLGHTGPVRAAAFSPDGRRVLSCSGWPQGDGTLRLWDATTGQELRRFGAPGEQFIGLAYSPDGRRALTGSDTGAVRIWDLETGEVRRFPGHSQEVAGVAFAPDGKRALTASNDNTIRLWDVETGRLLHVYPGHTNWVRAVAFSPDGRRFLSGGRDNTMRLWDVETGQQLRRFEGQTGWVEAVAFSPDGRLALSGGDDRFVHLWEVDTGRELRRFEGHRFGVNGVAFSPDGRLAVSGAYDAAVRCWDLDTGEAVGQYNGHHDWVWCVGFSPDGRRVISAGGGTEQTREHYVAGSDFGIRIWASPAVRPLTVGR